MGCNKGSRPCSSIKHATHKPLNRPGRPNFAQKILRHNCKLIHCTAKIQFFTLSENPLYLGQWLKFKKKVFIAPFNIRQYINLNTYRGSLPNSTFGHGEKSHQPNFTLAKYSLLQFTLCKFWAILKNSQKIALMK